MRKTKIIEYDASLDPSQIFGGGVSSGGGVDDFLLMITNNDGDLYKGDDDEYMLITDKPVYAQFINGDLNGSDPCYFDVILNSGGVYYVKNELLAGMIVKILKLYDEYQTSFGFNTWFATKQLIYGVTIFPRAIYDKMVDQGIVFLPGATKIPNEDLEFTCLLPPYDIDKMMGDDNPASSSTLSMRNMANTLKLKKQIK